MNERTSKFIEICSAWKLRMQSRDVAFESMLEKAQRDNPWFTRQEVERSLKNICDEYLDETLLFNWLNQYNIESHQQQKSVGIIAAGNIPFVVFHDLLCAFAANAEVYIKLSEKDRALPEYGLELLTQMDMESICRFRIVSKLPEVDKYIITGSSLTKNYFQSYLKGKPSLIRGHRSSVAICNGQESEKQLASLGSDIFSYFGLGCRNVTKLYIPSHFDVTKYLEFWDREFEYLNMVVPYMRNFEYQRAVKLLNRILFFESRIMLLESSAGFSPPISTLYYETYDNVSEAIQLIHTNKDQIQCICASQSYDGLSSIPFGKSQKPALSEFQDQKDTILFLTAYE